MSRLRHGQSRIELFELPAGRGSTSHLLDSLLCRFPCFSIPELTCVVLQRHSDWNKAPAHPFTHHSPSKLLGMHFNLSDPKLTFDRIGLQPASPPPPVHSGQTCLVIAHPTSHPIPSTPQFPSLLIRSTKQPS
ncbi:hypothetical protein CROQUDRAFT_87730 [Cronartium quercuum f. sp. fusiforme G11]|uniref:Uncharacterized protein n=1 Tax=Cronartium quercuum f. sp. fusiforme G11 TaxID=708437 RepID=A0A9P6NQX1_9BASI|nr:hypothetical protein CROQUDRAFT_87730 [Cronartium quercuum f. sp. fusiforme G11]